MEYTIWCDESVDKGTYYSDFYGGVLAKSNSVDVIKASIAAKKMELNMHGEVKWTKVTQNYLDKYIELISHFFTFVRSGKLKVRIMFTQNCNVATNLTKRHYEDKFFLLYYQFIKHAFGLTTIRHQRGTQLRVYFDKLPDKNEKCAEFKDHIFNLNAFFNSRQVTLKRENIAEVDSKQHDLLQCLDIILGAMAFRLNEGHRAIPPGKKRRGKKTIAKENLYKHIRNEICKAYPHFNIGENTGKREGDNSYWSMSYRHWKFVPNSHVYDPTKTK